MVITSVIRLLCIVHILVGGTWNHIIIFEWWLLVIGWALMLKQCYCRTVNMEALSDAVDHQLTMVKTASMARSAFYLYWVRVFSSTLFRFHHALVYDLPVSVFQMVTNVAPDLMTTPVNPSSLRRELVI